MAAAVAAPVRVRPERKNARVQHRDTVLLSGTLRLPEEVIRLALQGEFTRTTHRHVVVRLKHRGVIYIFREIALTLDYVGEVAETQAGAHRVHVWRVIDRPGKTEITHEGAPAGQIRIAEWEV